MVCVFVFVCVCCVCVYVCVRVCVCMLCVCHTEEKMSESNAHFTHQSKRQTENCNRSNGLVLQFITNILVKEKKMNRQDLIHVCGWMCLCEHTFIGSLI